MGQGGKNQHQPPASKGCFTLLNSIFQISQTKNGGAGKCQVWFSMDVVPKVKFLDKSFAIGSKRQV